MRNIIYVASDNLADLYGWGPKILTALQALPQLADSNSDQQNKGARD